MLWNHDPFQPPIGKATKLEILDDKIEATFQFRPKGENALADDVFSAFKGGFLSSFSIGFRVFDVDKTGKDAKTGDPLPPRITDAELFEISAVTIPANTDAVVRHDRMLRTLKSAIYGGQIEAATVYSAPTDLDVLKRAALIARERRDKLSECERKALDELGLAVFCAGIDSAPEADLDMQKLAEAVQGFRAELAEAVK
jgi:HK97 family phage prohead protease